MKQLKKIKNKIVFEKYYDPGFNWSNPVIYEQKFSKSFIKEFKDKIDWPFYFLYSKFTFSELKYLYKNYPKVFTEDTFDSLCITRYWTFKEIEYFFDKLSLGLLFQFNNKNMSTNTLIKLIEKVGVDNIKKSYWFDISFSQLPETFIKKFKDYIDWTIFLENNKCSEKFLIKYEKYLDWTAVSQWQDLSESFIEKYQKKVNWFEIFQGQELSEEFCKRWKYKYDEFCENNYIN